MSKKHNKTERHSYEKYEAPKLTVYGKMSILTTAGSGQQNENDEGGNTKKP
jgi:hypothetical protein